MSAFTSESSSVLGNNRGKTKSTSGWAAFDHKQRQKLGLEPEIISDAYPLLSGPSASKILSNKNGAPLEKPFSSVVAAPMNFPSLSTAHNIDLPRQVSVTDSCLGNAEKIETGVSPDAYQKLNDLHPWADQSLIQDVLAGVNNNIHEALSLLEAMVISEERDDKNTEGELDYGEDAVPFNKTDDYFEDSSVESKDDGASPRLLLDTAIMSIPVEPEIEWEEDDVYLIHRKDALRMIRSASHHSKAATDAYVRGDHASAHLYSLKAQEEWTAAEKLNAKAAEKILTIRNHNNDPWTLDLHGLHAPEAVEALQERLQKVESLSSSNCLAMASVDNKESRTHVKLEKFGRQHPSSGRRSRLLQAITGSGNHSRGAASLPSAIRNFLNENGYHFDETRPGVIMIRPKFRQPTLH
ncbi:hypothetical protein ACJIZ3_004666 [Penstemon smallii]|uniref:Smr domain-containing protein n=1 Tax=Penstemon smallii TaxID=265156 RepID=A0ABD3S2P9_9LAMI